MNVFDFDKTLFYPDSSYLFFMYCLGIQPAAVIPTLPAIVRDGLKYKLGILKTKQLKETVFSFLNRIDDIDACVSSFWNKHIKRIYPWYYKIRREDDLIISASPFFLLKPVAEYLGTSLIATDMDKYTGKINGENCMGEEKLKRFNTNYPGAKIDCFYSDSHSDLPLANIAREAFMIKKGKILPWK